MAADIDVEALLWPVADGALALLMVAMAWLCVLSRSRLAAIVLFTAFGVLTALAWARLSAPDLALAEAAIGSGMTGALLVAAWSAAPRARGWAVGAARHVAALGAAVLAMVLCGWSVWPLLQQSAGLAAQVSADIAATGVSHPVTAVLLDFRSFDTLLELAVLMAALAATWRVGLERAPFTRPLSGSVARIHVRTVAPLLVLLAGALLWRGAHAPGGAFQAGATLAAAGLLLILLRRDALQTLPWQRFTVAAGVLVFAAAGVGAGLASGQVLNWPDAQAAAFILAIEAAATLAIALTLVVLVVGTPGTPAEWRPTNSHGGSGT